MTQHVASCLMWRVLGIEVGILIVTSQFQTIQNTVVVLLLNVACASSLADDRSINIYNRNKPITNFNRENYIYSFPWNVPKSHGPGNVPIWVTSEKFVMTHVQDTPDKYLTNICFEEISFVCYLLVCCLSQMPHTILDVNEVKGSCIKVRTEFVWSSCNTDVFRKTALNQ